MTDSKIEMHFETGSNNTFFNNSRINVAGNFYTTKAPEEARKSELDIKKLLEELLEAKDENGKKLMVNQQMWYAVFKVFSERLGYAQKMSQFAISMKDIGMDKVAPPCKADSLRKAQQNCYSLEKHKVAEWVNLKDKGANYAEQWRVAQWLLDRI